MEKKIVLVQFGQVMPNAQSYAYFTVLDVKVGDVVVAEVPRGMNIVTVTQTEDITNEVASWASKWIIDTVNIKAHKQAMEDLNEHSC